MLPSPLIHRALLCQRHHPGGSRDGTHTARGTVGDAMSGGSVALREPLPNTSTVGSSQGLSRSQR